MSMPHTITPEDRLMYLLSAQKRQRNAFNDVEYYRERNDVRNVIISQQAAQAAYVSIRHWRGDED